MTPHPHTLHCGYRHPLTVQKIEQHAIFSIGFLPLPTTIIATLKRLFGCHHQALRVGCYQADNLLIGQRNIRQQPPASRAAWIAEDVKTIVGANV